MKNEKQDTNETVNALRTWFEQLNRNAASYTTQASYKDSPENYEHPQGESLTESDMTLPIPEIMRRAMQGIKPQSGIPFYGENDLDDEDLLKIQSADLIERTAAKKRTAERLEAYLEASSAPSPIDEGEEKMKPA